MRYIITRAWQRLKWNKWISILMIVEMVLGMSVLVYAMNMYSSLVKEERRRANQSRDLCLDIGPVHGNRYWLYSYIFCRYGNYDRLYKSRRELPV